MVGKFSWMAVILPLSMLLLLFCRSRAESQSAVVAGQQSIPLVKGRVVQKSIGEDVQGGMVTPLQGVTVTLTTLDFEGPDAYREVSVTDKYGAFRFKYAQSRPYSLTAALDGFVDASYSSDLFLGGMDLNVRDSLASTRSINFSLMREAIIQGVVVGADGKAAGAGIRVIAQGATLYQQSVTDAQGKFTLRKLRPGSYCVCGDYRLTDRAFKINVDRWGAYRETWTGPGISGTGYLQLGAGQEEGDVQITIEAAKKYAVHVWPAGPGDIPPGADYIAQLEHLKAGEKQPDGSYLISDVPPGHYSLTTSAWIHTAPWLLGQGETDFDVSDTDVTLHVPVGGVGTVRGVVKYDDTGSAVPEGVRIGLHALEGQGGGNKDIDADGQFLFTRIPEGRYFFTLDHLPIGTVWQSVKCNGVTVDGTSPLQVGTEEAVSGCELILASDVRPYDVRR